ncbi:hypothetical protein BV22DRAFT_1030469 [Leucogyrophana mollusca]|uniref:Uncharacterized protein n=1 Tax=Leucogyrophana mollusca TaxID=85980 RepID=A0ACB8BRW0_9AGAM|nr:hypothetical protein BV22DRAFT_1030469 [Leucogyrophana mollusca]
MTEMRIAKPQFDVFKKSVRSLAEIWLEQGKSFDAQPPETREKFREKVIEKNKNLMSNYEGAWPVEAYTRQYLSKRLGSLRWAVRHKRNDRRASVAPPGSRQMTLSRTQSSIARAPSPSPPPPEQPRSHFGFSPSPSPAPRSPSPPLLREADGSVVEFLASVSEEFARLAPEFARIGLGTGRALDLFSKFHPDDRREFLRASLRGSVNGFEVFAINTKLGSRTSEAKV